MSGAKKPIGFKWTPQVIAAARLSPRRWIVFFLVLFTPSAFAIHAQQGPPKVSVHFHELSPEVIAGRLDRVARKNADRYKVLKELFEQAGCTDQRLREQPVPKEKLPNLICTLPGKTSRVVIVGAHYDHVSFGMGVVDNWSGVALLPSLYESLSREQRNHTFVFVGFTAEENGLKGSRFFADQLTHEQIGELQAMINLDSLGLGPLNIWASRSDTRLVAGLLATANAMKLAVKAVNADQVGDEDSRPFRDRGVRTLTLHSITQETLGILHSTRDKKSAVKMDDYVDSYRLLAAYLAFLDAANGPS